MTIELTTVNLALLAIFFILAVIGLAHVINYLSRLRLTRVDADEPATKKIDVPPQT